MSVVILNYNRPETTVKSVECVLRSEGDYVGEILVVDNGSPQEEVEYLADALVGKARFVEVGTNRYFGEGNNIGAEEAAGDFLLLLNNDAYVEPECVEELVRTMAADDSVAGVGPMFLYPNGRVQEVGGIVLETGDVVQIGKGAIWGPDHYREVCAVDYCSAACLLLRREHFHAIGGFALQWEPAYYEDVDLCLSLWDAFGRVVVNPVARVTHLESLTTGDAAMRLESQVEINRLSFVEKWGDWIKAKKGLHRFATHQVVPLKEGSSTSQAKETVAEPGDRDHGAGAGHSMSAALFSPYELVPGGGERVLFEIADLLANSMDVAMASPHRYSSVRMRQLSQAFGLDSVPSPVPYREVDEANVDIGFVLGNEVAPPVPAFGTRVNVYICQFPFSAPEGYLDEHGPHLATFDEVWVYSDYVRRYFSGHARLRGLQVPPIRVMYPPATLVPTSELPPWKERHTVMTVGRFFKGGHDKRQDVAIDIVKGLSERLGRSVPLVVAGSLHVTPQSRDRFRELVQMAEGHDCRFYPNVSRARLVELYANAAALVHAAGFGVDRYAFPERLEHFGIVPLEAASLGCIPLPFGEGGPAEVMGLLESDSTFHDVTEAIDKLEALFADPDGATRRSDDLRKRSEMFSSEAFRRRVTEALTEILR